MAQFSVMPYTSSISTPNRAHHSTKDGEIGAAPLIKLVQLFKPNPFLILLRIILFITGMDNKIFNLLCGSFDRMPIWNLVQMRGTAKKMVGCASARFFTKRSRLSANHISLLVSTPAN